MTRKRTVPLVITLLIFAVLFILSAPATGIILSVSMPASAPSMHSWVGVLYLLFLLALLIVGVRGRGGVVLALFGVYAAVCLTLSLIGFAAMVTPVFFIGFLFLTLAAFLVLPIFTLYAYLVPALAILAVLLLAATVLFWFWYIRPQRARKKEKERLWLAERRKCLQQLGHQGKGDL